MNLFVINGDEKVVFMVDGGFSPSLAKKTCARFNSVWSKTLGDASTRLSCIIGYVISPKDELTYKQALKLFKEQN